MFKLRTTGWAFVHQLVGADLAGITICFIPSRPSILKNLINIIAYNANALKNQKDNFSDIGSFRSLFAVQA